MMYAAIETMYQHGKMDAAAVFAAAARGWITEAQAHEIVGEGA